MTKEEARQFGISLLEGIVERNTGKYAENVRLAIAALTEPLLSSNIDEAAEEYAWKKEQPLSDGERLSIYFNPRIDAFKSGAEWLAGQGETINGEIITTSDYGWETIRIPKKLYPVGTEVIVQIRKK